METAKALQGYGTFLAKTQGQPDAAYTPLVELAQAVGKAESESNTGATLETVESLTAAINAAIGDYNNTLLATQAAKVKMETLEIERFAKYRETTELRNTEIFSVAEGEMLDQDGNPLAAGWYYWYCVPGCLPDSEPFGGYLSQQAAVLAAYSEQYELDLQALV